MGDVRSRLISCFAIVFPTLSEQEIPITSVASVSSWDSLTSAILIATIEEEFGIQVGLNDLEQFVSFDLIMDYLQGNELQRNT